MKTIQRLICSSVILLGACAGPTQKADEEYDAGLRAEASKDFRGARRHYEAALREARTAGLPKNYISAATYDLGRMVGYACDYPGAERLLLEALRLEESLPIPGEGFILKRLSELARLSYDAGKFKESVAYYERAIPRLEAAMVPESDPLGFAGYLEDYALAQDKTGNTQGAASVRARATQLRSENPTLKAGFVPVHYRDVCKGK